MISTPYPVDSPTPETKIYEKKSHRSRPENSHKRTDPIQATEHKFPLSHQDKQAKKLNPTQHQFNTGFQSNHRPAEQKLSVN